MTYTDKETEAQGAQGHWSQLEEQERADLGISPTSPHSLIRAPTLYGFMSPVAAYKPLAGMRHAHAVLFHSAVLRLICEAGVFPTSFSSQTPSRLQHCPAPSGGREHLPW